MVKTLKEINLDFEKFLEVLPKEYSKEKIRTAYEFSKKAHKEQKRLNGDPYIIHPLEVSKIVLGFGLDEVSLISSFLHDVVEDTDVTLKTIKKEFGKDVELIVDGLSKIQLFGESKEEKNIEALRKILLASSKDIRILLIKLCDRLHNMRTLEELHVNKQERISRETLEIYAPIAQKVGIYSLKWELEDLSLKYLDPQMYQNIKEKVSLKRNEREEVVDEVVNEVKEVLDKAGYSKEVVLGRPKNFYSIYKKIKDKAKSFDDLYDLYAIRIIVESVTDCYTILGVLHERFQAFPDKLKDYIANPKSNGYQSLHTVVFSRVLKRPIEIQIRTIEMHKLAEFGVAAHWKYKNIKEDKRFEKKISWLRQVLEWEKNHKDNLEFLQLLRFDFFDDEIFVFTPKNDLISLPENATPLDFAFAVHTEVGLQAYKAKINGIIHPLDKTLNNGDIVEIVTHPSAKPSKKWLKVVKTARARARIRNALDLKFSKRKNIETSEISFDELKKLMTRIGSFKKVRQAGCCDLEYGDQIIGVINKGGSQEIVIHNASCENAKYTLHEKMPLNWIKVKNKEVEIEIRLYDKFGVLVDILNVVSDFNLNISQFNSKIYKDGKVLVILQVLDGPYIDSLLKKLKALECVESVKKVEGFLEKILGAKGKD